MFTTSYGNTSIICVSNNKIIGMSESYHLENEIEQPLAKKARSHYDTLSSNLSQKVSSKKKERQQRYREQNREKLSKREAERRKRKQYLQSIAAPFISSNINRIKFNNKEILHAKSQSSSGLEACLEETHTLSIQRDEHTKEKHLALQKKRERQQRYREQNREKLKQREAERRQRLQNSEMIMKSSTSKNVEFIETVNKPTIDEISNNSQNVAGLEEMQDLFVEVSLRNGGGQSSANGTPSPINYKGSSCTKALTRKKPKKTHTRKSLTRPANVETLSSTNHAHITPVTGSVHIKVEPEEGGRGSPGKAGPQRGAVFKVELFEVDESGLTCDQRNDEDVKFHFNSLRNEDGIARQVPKHAHQLYKCSACGCLIEGFRYACVQCADYDQCAKCEASGAHAEHYVLRVPRVERATELQTVLDRVRRELMLLDNPVQIKLEKDDDDEEAREEEILVLKTEPVELKGEGEIYALQCSGAEVGGGAVKQEVIDPDENLFKCNKVIELPKETTYRPRGRPRGCSTPLEPVTERRRRKARESDEQRQLRLQQHRQTQRNRRQFDVRRQRLDHEKSLQVRSADSELPELPLKQP